MSRKLLLAGVSTLAILASAAESNADVFPVPGMFSFTAPVSGEYALDLLGASGGDGPVSSALGGLGAEVSGDVFLTSGEDLTLYVGGRGKTGVITGGGGGGGGSFVFLGTQVLAVAGGGGGGVGVSFPADGGNGLITTGGGAGGGGYGGAGGANGSGGGGGTLGDSDGGGGAGVAFGAAGYGGDGAGGSFGFGAKFPNGGAGYSGSFAGGDGGFGGGGGGGSLGGGGGGGFSGGGGGGGGMGYGAGGGGGSYLASLFTNPVLTAGVNSGDGSISINLLTAAPEPSTWAMTLAGFAGLGWLARMRRRKASPA